ncbi:response regulator [Actinotalea sp.]|uniref:response regulator transcription factor n=1 Tax=Actinotalea sp. TaxID=1872145 RepID=UPI003565ECC9
MIRVLLVDDDALVRRLLRQILTAQGLEVVGEATDGDEAVPAVQRHRPDVVLMDLRMARMGGVPATVAVRALPNPTSVLALTSFDTRELVHAALNAGAQGFLAKDAAPSEIVAAVQNVAGGLSALGPRAARYVVDAMTADPAAAQRDRARQALEVLTDRELEIAAAVASGRTNAEVAASTYCSEATVKTHLSRAMDKIGVANRVQLALVVDRAGLAPA